MNFVKSGQWPGVDAGGTISGKSGKFRGIFIDI